jgi:hypothetical protein
MPVLAAALLLASPAFAQTSPSTAPSQTGQPAAGNPAATSPQPSEQMRQGLRQSLEQNGFKNVNVIPIAFLIRAETPDGARVIMQVRPDRFAELTERNGAAAQNGTARHNMGSGMSAATAPSGATQSGTLNPSRGGGTAPNGVSTDTSRQVRQSLERNGFKDIQVVPEAFVIRANAPDGSRIVMEVTPDEVEGIVDAPSGSGSASSGSASSGSNGSGSASSGSSNR